MKHRIVIREAYRFDKNGGVFCNKRDPADGPRSRYYSDETRIAAVAAWLVGHSYATIYFNYGVDRNSLQSWLRRVSSVFKMYRNYGLLTKKPTEPCISAFTAPVRRSKPPRLRSPKRRKQI